jgi:hypothetical protein
MKINKRLKKALSVSDELGFVVRSIYYEDPYFVVETQTCKLIIHVNRVGKRLSTRIIQMYYKY